MVSDYIVVFLSFSPCAFWQCVRIGLHTSMASKETPKKIYSSFTKRNIDPKSCRLCRSIGDSSHRTNIFKPSNKELLKIAESLYGRTLRKDTGLPSLVCRPCDRRLKNAIEFRKVICKAQQEIEESETEDITRIRVKRCVEISPSIQKSSGTHVATMVPHSSGKRRKSLDFSSHDAGDKLSTAIGYLSFQVCCFLYLMYFTLSITIQRENRIVFGHRSIRIPAFSYGYILQQKFFIAFYFTHYMMVNNIFAWLA